MTRYTLVKLSSSLVGFRKHAKKEIFFLYFVFNVLRCACRAFLRAKRDVITSRKRGLFYGELAAKSARITFHVTRSTIMSSTMSLSVVLFLPIVFTNFDTPAIGVASCGALRHVPPRLIPTVWFFWSLQSRTNSDIGLYGCLLPKRIYRPIALSPFIAWIS